MRRTNILSLSAVTIIVLTVLVSGCGGDSGRARKYLKQGDEMVAAVEKQGEELGAIMNEAFADLYQEVSSGAAPDVEGFQRAADEIESLADEMIDRAARARSTFEQVDALEDVPGYKKYAALKVEIIDKNVKGLEELKAFLQDAAARLASSDFDMITFQSFVTQYGEAVKTLGNEGGKLQEQAEKLKKSEKL